MQSRGRWRPARHTNVKRLLHRGNLTDITGRDYGATAPPTTSILPSKKGEGGPSGPPPQRSTMQTH